MVQLFRWLRSAESELYRQFVETPNGQTLGALLSHFTKSTAASLSCEDIHFRQALEQVQEWTIDKSLLVHLCDRLERYLVEGHTRRAADWKSWLRVKEAIGDPLTFDSPALISGLVGALAEVADADQLTDRDRRRVSAALAAFALRVLRESSRLDAIDTCQAVSLLSVLATESSATEDVSHAVHAWWNSISSEGPRLAKWRRPDDRPLERLDVAAPRHLRRQNSRQGDQFLGGRSDVRRGPLL
jgi:hypothetical protein